jgi:hypothetical protein
MALRQGSVIALDQETGERAWSFSTRKHVRSSPLYLKPFQAIVVCSNDNDCICLNAHRTIAVDVQYVPCLGGGHLKSGHTWSREVKSRPSYAMQAELVIFGCFDGHNYALHAKTGDSAWKVATEGIVYSEPLIVGERAYATSTDKRLYVLDLQTAFSREFPPIARSSTSRFWTEWGTRLRRHPKAGKWGLFVPCRANTHPSKHAANSGPRECHERRHHSGVGGWL